MDRHSSLIFVGGIGPDTLHVPWHADLVLAADSGYALCRKLGYQADVLIGDMDSIDPAVLKEIAQSVDVQLHDTNKNRTDLELCLAYAQEQQSDDVSIIGGEGLRIDHFIGQLFLFGRRYSPQRMFTAKYQIEYVQQSVRMAVGKGKYVSLFSLPELHTRVRSKGLRWKLDGLELTRDCMSISNESSEECVELELLHGELLMLWEHEGQARRPS